MASNKMLRCIRWTLDPAREGGYANIPGDKGGETYRGIARNFFPRWEGWEILDLRKPIKHNRIFDDLEPRVEDFYHREFWNMIDGDDLAEPVARAVFDLAVHSGTHRAESVLEAVREELNLHGGEEANATAEAIWRWRGHYLLNRAFSEPDQLQFLLGWMTRVRDGVRDTRTMKEST